MDQMPHIELSVFPGSESVRGGVDDTRVDAHFKQIETTALPGGGQLDRMNLIPDAVVPGENGAPEFGQFSVFARATTRDGDPYFGHIAVHATNEGATCDPSQIRSLLGEHLGYTDPNET